LRKKPSISIIVPVFNEEVVLPEFFRRIEGATEVLREKYTLELIMVNDGSTDGTLGLLRKFKLTGFALRIIDLNRNYGHMQALLKGMELASGDLVITLDCDLQDPPEIIPELVQLLLKTESEIIQTVRTDRKSDSFFKRISSSFFYALIGKLSDVNLVAHAADYRVVTAKANAIICKSSGQNKVFRFFIPSLGLKTTYFRFVREARFAGKTKYPLHKMVSLGIDSLTSASTKPLRWMILCGLYFSTLMIFAMFLTLGLYFTGDTIPGWASLACLFLASNSILLTAVAIIGEYVGKIYMQGNYRIPVHYQEY
jgi:dolichol-phosphate mannosyltransferase